MRNQFGAFGGVFTPCILTILGVIMFMRANFVVGHAGILGAVLILILAKSIPRGTLYAIGVGFVVYLVQIVIFGSGFSRETGASDCVFLGFDAPEAGAEAAWYATYERLVLDDPTTVLVCSAGDEDLLA